MEGEEMKANYFMNFIYLFIFTSIIYSDRIYNYNISSFGFNVADCKVIYSDTLIVDEIMTKIKYRVVTNQFISNFFEVDNDYTIILDDHYNTFYYNKNTIQPKVVNEIETKLENGVLSYNNSDVKIQKEDINIFSVLYMIHIGDLESLSTIKLIEREGKYYDFKYLIDNNKIEIIMNELDSENKGLIRHTDIFSWGLFLKDSHKTIIYNEENKYIEKCIFKKGVTKITASLMN